MDLPETIADNVLDQLEIIFPDDLLLLKQIIHQRGAIYDEKYLEGAEARLTLGLDKAIISVSTKIKSFQRKRFSIAHELGHLELHSQLKRSFFCNPSDIQYKPDQAGLKIEQEANKFAASFLMPSRFIEKPFVEEKPSFDLIKEWSNTLQTSITATAFRFVKYTKEPIAVTYLHKGIIQYFQSSTEFNELGVFLRVGELVGRSSIAYQLVHNYSLQDEWQTVKAINWFRKNEDAFDSSDNIQEWSIGMPRYNGILSLLWVRDPLGWYGR